MMTLRASVPYRRLAVKKGFLLLRKKTWRLPQRGVRRAIAKLVRSPSKRKALRRKHL